MRKYTLLYLFVALLMNCLSLRAQYHTDSKRAIKFFQDALSSFDRRMNENALESLEKAIRIDDEFVEAYMMRAQIFKEMGEIENAIRDFSQALSLDPDFYPEGYMVLASVQFGIGKYNYAKRNIEKFLEFKEFSQINKTEAEQFLEKVGFALRAVQSPVPFNPVNLGDSINSELNEYWPSLSLDESRIVFTVMLPKPDPILPGEASVQEDFYYAEKRPDGSWSQRKNAGTPLNTEKNEGAQTISANGRLLIFTGCDRNDGFGKCDIYYSYSHDTRWTIPVNIGSPVNTRHSDKHPSLSSDGQVLYFASDRPGGRGGLDIWYSKRDSRGAWSIPVNMGDSINTPGDEQSPFIHPDNRTLYFSSQGHMNMGKGDIFISRRLKDGGWGKAENIGYPINTHNDEIGLAVGPLGKMAYFSSDRLNERGMDIYRFELYDEIKPVPVSYVKGRVFDAETRRGIDASFELIDLETGKLEMFARSDMGDGMFLLPLPSNKNYALNVSHSGYLFYSDHFEMKGIYVPEKPYMIDVPLKRIKKGEIQVLRNVFYEFDSDSLLNESIVELEKVVEFLEKNPSVNIRVNGHTDNIGNEEYNKDLSARRAISVIRFLTSRGISENRLDYRGFGDSDPVTSNETEEGRAQNRRTEIEIID